MISIKKATLIDLTLLTQLAKTSFIESHGHSGPEKDINSYVEKNFTLEIVETEIKDPKNNYYIIYYNNKAAGFSNIIFNAPYESIKEETITKLSRLYLTKEFTGLKLGKALFEFNVTLSKQNAQTGMWLYVWTENKPALRFYEKAGFIKVEDTFFKISETHSNPNYIMYLRY